MRDIGLIRQIYDYKSRSAQVFNFMKAKRSQPGAKSIRFEIALKIMPIRGQLNACSQLFKSRTPLRL